NFRQPPITLETRSTISDQRPIAPRFTRSPRGVSWGDSSMSEPTARRPILAELYEQFLADRDQAAFIHRVAGRYTTPTLERLALHSSRWVRRGAVLALGSISD